MSWIVTNIWLIPATPLVLSLLILSLSNSRRTAAAGIAVLGQVIALAFAILAFLPTLRSPAFRAVRNFTWFNFGDQSLRLGWIVDPLAAAMLIMITLVGLCIFVFSIGYMRQDKNFTRFFAYLSFFSGAMLGVVIANSLLLLFVSWELVGLASYLLIGFWIVRPSAAAAAKKAFITTRIGDLAFFLGMLWLYHGAGTLLFYDNGNGALEPAALLKIAPSVTFVALLIFCGAVGKSGQFPLHVWLPDAMEGPTPVSALIHAATMVAAGVFLVARVYPLFSLDAVDGVTPSLTVVVVVGVVTALIASLIALAQFDIKRILAYSTISQLGLMMVSLGVGGVAAGIMHLIAHGFFKALLFLGAGSVIHGLHHEQDIRKMGGLRWVMPVTFLTYGVGMMNLSGVPFLFSGGWTKEEILHCTADWPVSRLPHYLMLTGVILTALYMTRQVIYVFLGNLRGDVDFQSVRPAGLQPGEPAAAGFNPAGRTARSPMLSGDMQANEHPHESPRVMTTPLIILAACSVVLAAFLTPSWPWLHAYLNGEPAHLDFRILIQPMLFLSLGLVGAGIGLGWWMYRNVGETDPLARRQPGLFRFLGHKMWIDEIYDHTVIAFSRFLSRLSDFLDRYLWDGLVNLFSGIGRAAAVLSKGFDERGINAGVDETAIGARRFGLLISARHSGQIQAYLGAIAVGMLLLLVLYAWLA